MFINIHEVCKWFSIMRQDCLKTGCFKTGCLVFPALDHVFAIEVEYDGDGYINGQKIEGSQKHSTK